MAKEYNMPVSVRIPIGLLERIDDAIEKDHEYTTRSDLILHAVRVYMDLCDGVLEKPRGGGESGKKSDGPDGITEGIRDRQSQMGE